MKRGVVDNVFAVFTAVSGHIQLRNVDTGASSTGGHLGVIGVHAPVSLTVVDTRRERTPTCSQSYTITNTS
jgi:hypothetical protein